MILITEMTDPRLKFLRSETFDETVVRVSLIKALLERDRAVKALTASGFKDLGGEAWKPPVNEYATLYHQNRAEFETLISDILDAVHKAVGVGSLPGDEDEYVDTMGHEIR